MANICFTDMHFVRQYIYISKLTSPIQKQGSDGFDVVLKVISQEREGVLIGINQDTFSSESLGQWFSNRDDFVPGDIVKSEGSLVNT